MSCGISIEMCSNANGYQVHHKLPLDDGGNNDFSNLILIENDLHHKVLTNSQKNSTKGLKVGD
ncbi:HNH endonuclease signature motif containing protein [Bacillus sp. Cs-700]|uniref:HNH endonuclease n=1 Tax=Bacillus sp. Cs-700 TaxID=2589818 RepID=UPI001407355C